MIKKTEQIVLTFNTSFDAISCERYCSEQGIEGRIIPVPRILSASCGMAFKAPLTSDESLSAAMDSGMIKPAEKYRLFL